jgi:hypothetical protein
MTTVRAPTEQGSGASADADQALVSDGAASVSTLTGFDPSRFERLAEGCHAIYERISDFAISKRFCEDVGRLERLHDHLANQVANLAILLGETADAIAMEARQGTDPEEGLDGAAATARAEGIARD